MANRYMVFINIYLPYIIEQVDKGITGQVSPLRMDQLGLV